MPYGIAKEHGGDTPENDAKMERCVAKVLKDDPKLSKASAIAICKDSIFGAKKGG